MTPEDAHDPTPSGNDDAEYVEMTYRSVEITGESKAINTFWQALRAVESAGWRRDESLELKWSESKVAESARVYVATGNVEGEPPANVWTFRDPWRVRVSNIVPTGRVEFGHARANALALKFTNDILAPLARDHLLLLRVGSDRTTLDDVCSARAAARLRSFSRCANKTTGRAHPLDNERWREFVFAAVEDGASLDWDFLSRWLEHDGFPQDVAERLANVFDAQRDVLQHRGGRPWRIESEEVLTDVVARLRDYATVLVLDTCALLDVIRLMSRSVDGATAVREFNLIKTVVDLASHPEQGLAIALPQIVVGEFARNRANVEAEVVRGLEGARSRISVAMALTSVASPVPESLGSEALGAVGRVLDGALERAHRVPVTDAESVRAFTRASESRPPARERRDSVRDCGIAEVVLRLGTTLGPMRPTVFLTTNKSDFDVPALRDEFSRNNVTLCGSWEHALHVVKRCSE